MFEVESDLEYDVGNDKQPEQQGQQQDDSIW